MNATACWSCDFWKRLRANGKHGACRRHAPIVFVQPALDDRPAEPLSVFPMTEENERCGDYVQAG